MPSPLDFDDYRKFLIALLKDKRRQNVRVSMRSVARDCGLSASYFSRVVRGLRKPEVNFVIKIARHLGFSMEETAYFLSLIEFSEAKGSEKRRLAQSLFRHRQESREFLKDDRYQIFKDWHHGAILALVETKGFKGDPRWIARRISVDDSVVTPALERLVQFGFLIHDGTTYRRATTAPLETPHDLVSRTVTENHRQQLHRAGIGLMKLGPEKREFSNVTMAIHAKDLPKIKKQLRHFMDRLIIDFEKSPGDEVAQFNMQFYVVTS